MKKSRSWCFTIFIFTAASLSAQISVQGGRGTISLNTVNLEPRQVSMIDGVAVMSYSNSAAEINGSPYLNEAFEDGTMTALDGTVIPGLKYRYDIYGDKMQFILGMDTATITKPLALRSIQLGEHSFAYEVYLLEANRVSCGYFEVIEDTGNLKVLHKRDIELEQDIYVSNYGGGGGTKEFKMKQVNSYYLKHGDSAARHIAGKKDLMKVIPAHQDQVRLFIKEKRLSVKKAEDLQAIAIYYSSLQPSGS
ncbi:MAG: hypothetical protein V2B15_16090 [Bacteroidota bacterium]